jgi:hypothetical protein
MSSKCGLLTSVERTEEYSKEQIGAVTKNIFTADLRDCWGEEKKTFVISVLSGSWGCNSTGLPWAWAACLYK